MRKLYPLAVSGILAMSFSPFAAAQPAQTGATVIQQRGEQNTNQMGTDNQAIQQQSSGQAQNVPQGGATASQEQYPQGAEDKRPGHPGKGWAKGHDKKQSAEQRSTAQQSAEQQSGSAAAGGTGNQAIQQQGSANQAQNVEQSGAQNQNTQQYGGGSSAQGQTQERR